MIQDSKKIKQRKRKEITIFNRFDIFTVEDEELNASSSICTVSEESEENLIDHSSQVLQRKNDLREETSKRFVRLDTNQQYMFTSAESGFVENEGEFEEVKLQGFKDYKVKNFKSTSRPSLRQKSKYSRRKAHPNFKLDSLKKFETVNPFQVLQHNSEENIECLVQRLNDFKLIQNMRKVNLKKCRTCHHKKRSCILDSTKCSAASKTCYFCGKTGHFPRSLSCKKFRQASMTKNYFKIGAIK